MKFCTSLAAALLILTLGASTAQAQATLYWDINGTEAGATPGANGIGDGTWDTGVTANWNPLADGTGTPVTWTNTADHAVFSAGNDVGTDFTVAGAIITVSSAANQVAGSVLIEDGYVAFRTGVVDTALTTVNTGATLDIDSILRYHTTPGKIVLAGGTFVQSNPGSAGSFIRNSQTLEIDGSGTIVYEGGGGGCNCSIYTPLGANTIAGTGGTTTNGGAGTLIKEGAGEIRYQGAGLPLTTYAQLIVKEGLFRLGFSASTQDTRGFGADPLTFVPDAIILDGGAIGTSFFLSQANLHPNRGITITANGGTFNNGGGSLNVQGLLSGSGPITIAGGGGTIAFSNVGNVNTYNGAVTVSAGTMLLNETLRPGSLSGTGGTVNIAAGKELIPGQDGTITTYLGTITGAGGVAKEGSGTFTMDGTKTYTGDTRVLAGTLSTNSASLADLADVYLTTGSFFNLNFAGNDVIDELFIDNTAQASGTWGALGSGAANETALITGTGLLDVTMGPGGGLVGDYNGDGSVDAADYVVWRKDPASHGGDPQGYNDWQANFGATAPGGGSGLTSAAVPEPATLALLILGIAATAVSRRGR